MSTEKTNGKYGPEFCFSKSPCSIVDITIYSRFLSSFYHLKILGPSIYLSCSYRLYILSFHVALSVRSSLIKTYLNHASNKLILAFIDFRNFCTSLPGYWFMECQTVNSKWSILIIRLVYPPWFSVFFSRTLINTNNFLLSH